jgi:multidrug efflux pump subunit AcrB
VLAIGLVVDDAIVVVENVKRQIYPAHPIIRNSLGSMTRKLSVTSSQ